MASLFFRGWSAAISEALHRLGFVAPAESRRAQAAELEGLADLLHHCERQMNQARIQYLCEVLSGEQLESFCRHKIDEVQHLLQLSCVRADCGRIWAMERVEKAIRNWHGRVQALLHRPLKLSDVSELQDGLEEMTAAVYICAKLEHYQHGAH